MSLVTVLIAKGYLICIPLGIGVIVCPGAVGRQKGIIKFAPLQGSCLIGHRPISRLKSDVAMCQKRAIAASPTSLQVGALWQGVAEFSRNHKRSLNLVVGVLAYQHLVIIT